MIDSCEMLWCTISTSSQSSQVWTTYISCESVAVQIDVNVAKN